MPKPIEEICTIRIMFPVSTDDEALGIKKKISELLVDIPDAHIQFSLMTPPEGKPVGSPIR